MTSQSAQINSPSKRFGLLAAALHLFAAVLFLICFFRQVSGHDRQVAVSGDAHGYVVTAYNLRTSGMFSHECQDFSGPCPEGKLVPTNYREPLYPMFLALALTLYPEELNRQEFMPAPNQMNPDLHAYLRKWTIGVTLLIAVLSFGTTFLICGSWIASYAVLFLVGTSAGLTENVEIFLSENLAGLLLIASVFFALLAIKRSRIAWLIPSGIAFGLLALTKGVYFYGHLALVAVTILFLVFSKFDRRKVATGLVVFSLFYGLCVGSWKLRNYLTFGSSSVASRGGIMLTIRVYYNMADSEEWKAMFWYATPLRKRFKQSEELLQRVIRLDRTNREGFYLGAKAYAANLSNQIGPTEAEKVLTREAFEKILADPLQHLWVSIPLAFNSLFTESSKAIGGRLIINQYDSGIILSIGMLLSTLIAVIGRNLKLFVTLAPALFSIAFHPLISNALPRYNQPIICIMWIAVVVAFYVLAVALLTLVARLFKRRPLVLDSAAPMSAVGVNEQ